MRNLKKEVMKFFLKDCNSDLAPSANDTITKEKMQKRFLLDTVKALYGKFCLEMNDYVSQTLFYRLKQFYVVKQKITARNIFSSKEHSNFTFMFNKLRKLGIIHKTNIHDCLENKFCSRSSEKCMFRLCNICKSFHVDNVNDCNPPVSYNHCSELKKKNSNRSKRKNL